ncbi:MAG: GLPGLI family protein [Candidatus Limimorpha sp.]
MKRILFLVFVLQLGVFALIAQIPYEGIACEDYKTIDTSRLVLSYEFLQVRDTSKPEEKSHDHSILEIGRNYSRFYSYYLCRYDSLYTALMKRGASGMPGAREDIFPVDIYKEYAAGIVIVVQRTPMRGLFEYMERLNPMTWEVTGDAKRILNYSCKKATCVFRGRKWVAWFTPDIPLSDGPWKFSGLPGLILQAEDSLGQYKFNCIGIGNEERDIRIVQSYGIEKTNRERMRELEKTICTNYFDYLQIVMPGLKNFRTRQGEKMTREQVNQRFLTPYNPIELE